MGYENIDEAEEVILQFGKFKDRKLEDVPTWYLKWLAENHDSESLCHAADVVYQERSDK